MPRSFYDTHALIAATKQMVPPRNFLRDRYFPFNPSADLFSTERVLVEIQDGDKKMAPFVTPMKNGVLMERNAARMEELEPPTIAPSRILTADMLKKRGFGEALNSELSPQQRAQQFTLQDIADLNDAISRREEKISSDLLFTNKALMKHITDDPNKTDDMLLDFTGDEPSNYILAAKWEVNTPWITIESDIHNMILMLTRRGLPATDLILGTNVALVLKNNEELIKHLDTRNLDTGVLSAEELSAGATLLGHLVVMGHKLNLITYDETYRDDDGEIKEFVPTNRICLTAPASGRRCYGSTVLIPEGQTEFVNYTNDRVPQYIVDRDHNIRKITVHSHPLLMPRNVNPWIVSEVTK